MSFGDGADMLFGIQHFNGRFMRHFGRSPKTIDCLLAWDWTLFRFP